MTAAAASLKQTRMTILLSVNAAAIVIAGVLIASAIGLTGNGDIQVVGERSDEIEGSLEEVGLNEAQTEYKEGGLVTDDSGNGQAIAIKPAGANVVIATGETTNSEGKATGGSVPAGELWNETSATIYASADRDICIDNSLPGYSNMYWQTSNKNVIRGFYAQARNYLGYDSGKCRYPLIVGTGTTTITAGTYDGTRRDSIDITVVDVPADQWKQEVLALVNQQRAAYGLGGLSWSGTTAPAAMTRAAELISSYSHTRPDGSPWNTVIATPAGGYSGENLAAGPSAVSPATVVNAWMNSESHRANILNPNFRFLSVGFVFDMNTQYRTYWSQIFTSW